MIIKLLLLAGLLVAAGLAYRSPLSHAAPRCVDFLDRSARSGGGGGVLPLPGDGLCRPLGVGRGTDLLVYFVAVVSLLAFLSLWRRIYELEQKIVLLTRHSAIHGGYHDAYHEAAASSPATDPAAVGDPAGPQR